MSLRGCSVAGSDAEATKLREAVLQDRLKVALRPLMNRSVSLVLLLLPLLPLPLLLISDVGPIV